MSKPVPKSNRPAPLPVEAKVPQPETGYGEHRLYTGQQMIHASNQASGESICTKNIHRGEVVVEGSFLPADKETFLRIAKHTEEKSWLRNPMSKIISVLDEKDRIEIQTTTALLAERIGKELSKCHKGQLQFKRSPGEKFTRVHWLCEQKQAFYLVLE